MSKVQADNQIRFQDIETAMIGEERINNVTKIIDDKNLPGSSTPQDLGSVSYKDTVTTKQLKN